MLLAAGANSQPLLAIFVTGIELNGLGGVGGLGGGGGGGGGVGGRWRFRQIDWSIAATLQPCLVKVTDRLGHGSSDVNVALALGMTWRACRLNLPEEAGRLFAFCRHAQVCREPLHLLDDFQTDARRLGAKRLNWSFWVTFIRSGALERRDLDDSILLVGRLNGSAVRRVGQVQLLGYLGSLEC